MRSTKPTVLRKGADVPRASPLTVDDALLTPIKEENLPTQTNTGSADTSLTTEGMEPLTTKQSAYIDAVMTQARLEADAEKDKDREYYEQEFRRMRQTMYDMQEQHNDLLASMRSTAATTLPPVEPARHAFETPKVQRPQDRAYQEILTAQKTQQKPEEPHTSFNATNPYNASQSNQAPNEMMKVYDIRMNNLMSSMGNILKYSKQEDTTELPKFQGGDSQWPKWYQLLRAY